MEGSVLVTGASSGIGRAFAVRGHPLPPVHDVPRSQARAVALCDRCRYVRPMINSNTRVELVRGIGRGR